MKSAQGNQQNSLGLQTGKRTNQMIQALTKTLSTQDKRQIDALQSNYEDKFLNGQPPKIKNIENKLQSFRDEKIIHEIQALKVKQEEEEKERQWLQTLRQAEIEKLKAAHQFVIDQDKRIYQFWSNTEKVKHDRIAKETTLNQAQTQKIKDSIMNYKKEESNDVQQSLQYFIQTCIRQGIELKHDPDKSKKIVEKAKFSAVATMMKIKDRTKKNQEAQKAREKRRNKMLVEQQRQQEEIERKKKEEEEFEKHQQKCIEEARRAKERSDILARKEKAREERMEKALSIQEKQMEIFEELKKQSVSRELAIQQQRVRAFREQQIKYMEINLENKIKKRYKIIRSKGKTYIANIGNSLFTN